MSEPLVTVTSETLVRAERAGLRRDEHGWSRHGTTRLVARADDGRWWWAPEDWVWGDVSARAPRYAGEEEALSAALAWLEAIAPLGPPRVPARSDRLCGAVHRSGGYGCIRWAGHEGEHHSAPQWWGDADCAPGRTRG